MPKSYARGGYQGAVHRLANLAGAMLLGAIVLLAANLGDSESASAQGSAPAYRAAVIADAPTSFWRLGESAGTTAADEMGRAPGSYIGGPALGHPGALVDDTNAAVLLDGTNDQVVATAAALNLPTAVSLEAWVKPTSLPRSGQARVVSRTNQYALYYDKNGRASLQLWKSSGSKTINATGAVKVGSWSHLVGTYDGTTMRLYVDGTQRASAAYAGPLRSSTDPTRLGSAGTGSWLASAIDEVAIYNKALAATQIASHYSVATTPQPPADTTPPAVSLTAPAEGSSGSDPRPTFSGAAGDATGDEQQVTVKVYAGTAAGGTPVQTLNTNRSGSSWSVTATDALAVGTYTAQAQQADAAGNVGQSATRTFTIAQPPISSYADLIVADGPRAYWQLGESAGTSAADRMGNHPGLYEFAPSLGQQGAIGGSPNTAVRFDGIDDQVRVPNSTALNSANAFSIETWLKPAQLPAYTSTVARKSGQFQLRLRYDGALSLIVWKDGTAATEVRTATGLIAPGDWYHLAVTYDGSELKLWVNGSVRGSLAIAAPLSTSTGVLYLASSGGYDWLDGTLDEVALYHSALSAERIGAHISAATTSPSDTTPPAVSLTQPAEGSSSSETRPTFSGAAGNDAGDGQQVTVKVYSGSSATGTPVQTLNTNRSGNAWSVTAANALADGTYTVRAEQSDAAGNVGQSGTRTFTVAQPPVSSYADFVLADGPRAYWQLGESSGTAAADRMGNHPGVYEFAPGLGQQGAIGGSPDTAVRFDGIDDQMRVPNSTALNSANAYSIETWLKLGSLPSYTSTIARKSGQFQLRLRYDGALSLIAWKNGAASTEIRTATGLIAPGDWYHVVVTYDGSELKLWVNGSVRGSLSLAAPLSVSTSALYVASSGGYDWLDGTLDELALYHSALSAERIGAHYDRAHLIDETAPTIALKTPAPASTMEALTNFGGKAGTAVGDRSDVTVRVWSGAQASGVPARVLPTTARASGSFSILADPALPTGTYTARAEQSDQSGNLGFSGAVTFSVNASAAPSLLAAGDVAHCASPGDEASADVLDRLPGTVAMIGDAAYENGTPAEFAACYDPSWGRHLARTKAIPGDHDYGTPGASGYFNYFGAAAGDPSKGYYSYDIGGWHVVALNSVCYELGSCESAMENWLQADLAAHPNSCTVGLLHEPRFSSGTIHGNNPWMQPLWQIMYDANVDVVLSGSEHIYERFAKQKPNGAADPQRGIREFIVGTGGRSHYQIGTVQPNSEVRNTDAFGILKLTLNPSSYDWQFVAEAGRSFTDAGSTACH